MKIAFCPRWPIKKVLTVFPFAKCQMRTALARLVGTVLQPARRCFRRSNSFRTGRPRSRMRNLIRPEIVVAKLIWPKIVVTKLGGPKIVVAKLGGPKIVVAKLIRPRIVVAKLGGSRIVVAHRLLVIDAIPPIIRRLLSPGCIAGRSLPIKPYLGETLSTVPKD